MPPTSQTRQSSFVIWTAILANIGIAILKFLAAFFTQSSSLLSEGIHSSVDTFNGILLLIGKSRSKIPGDRHHPFGHGKEIYFWSLIVAILIFGIGGGMSIYEGIHHLLHPQRLRDPAWSYGVLGGAIVFEGISFIFASREFFRHKSQKTFWTAFRTSKDPTKFMIFFEDAAALIGLLIALSGVSLGILLNQAWPDGIASILIGVLLGGVALLLARETKDLLLGESASAKTLAILRETMSNYPEVDEIRSLQTMHLGPKQMLVTARLHFKNNGDAADLEKNITELSAQLKKKVPEATFVFLSPEPA